MSSKYRLILFQKITVLFLIIVPLLKLIPLKELEQYIQKNSHLPEVPSAANIKEEGVKLAERSAILLKKVEELTLYIIEQNKRIEKLEKHIK